MLGFNWGEKKREEKRREETGERDSIRLIILNIVIYYQSSTCVINEGGILKSLGFKTLLKSAITDPSSKNLNKQIDDLII